MSPEECCGKPLRLSNDIWQIGCVLYYLMTRSHPFTGQVNTLNNKLTYNFCYVDHFCCQFV